jgi:hypothetical protein
VSAILILNAHSEHKGRIEFQKGINLPRFPSKFTDRKSKHHFPTACLWPASGGGRGPLAAPATPPARDSCLLERLAARRGAALRSLDMPLRMGEGESLRGFLVPGPRDGPAGKAEGGVFELHLVCCGRAPYGNLEALREVQRVIDGANRAKFNCPAAKKPGALRPASFLWRAVRRRIGSTKGILAPSPP